MSQFFIKNDKNVLINENNWPSTINKLTIEDGSLSIVNNSQEIKHLIFDEQAEIYIESFGTLNVSGKLVKIGETNDKKKQELIVPAIKKHSIGAIFVETKKGSGVFEPWLNINAKSLQYNFEHFANHPHTGKVFKQIEDKIIFTDNKEYGVYPGSGCRICLPNIIISTQNGDGDKSYPRFVKKLGGKITLSNVALSNISPSFYDFSYIRMENVSVLKSLTISYVDKFKLSNIGVSVDNEHSSGININYSQNGQIVSLASQSVKNFGITIAYSKNISMKNTKGVLINRDSGLDAAINIDTVQGLEVNNVTNIGGSLKINNINNATVYDVVSANTCNLKENSSYNQANVYIKNSSFLTIKDIKIIKGGSSYDSYMSIANSSNIDVIGLNSPNKFANYAVRCDVVYDSRFVDFKFDNVRSEDMVRLDSKSNGILLQNFICSQKGKIVLGSKNTVIKGGFVDDVVVDSGAYNTTFFQLYNNNGKGSLKIVFTKNNQYQTLKGNPKFDYSNGLLMNKGDALVYTIPFRVSGVLFDELDPVLKGKEDNVKFYIAVETAEHKSDFKPLNTQNLKELNKMIDGQFFVIHLKIDASELSSIKTMNLKEILLFTIDKREKYSIYHQKINISFSELLRDDSSAKYAILYKDIQNKNKMEVLTDIYGNKMFGKINGVENIEFLYDYEKNIEFGRTPNKPFEILCVAVSNGLAEPTEVVSIVNKNKNTNITLTTKQDNVYLLGI